MGSITRVCNIGHNTTITTNFHICIDPTISLGDTTDWITVLGSTTNTNDSLLIVNIGAGNNPNVLYGHFIDVRLFKNTTDLSFSTHKIEVRLIKANSILVATTGQVTGNVGSYSTFIYELTAAEIGKLENNYSDLSFHIIGYGHDSLSHKIPWVRFRYPQIVPC